MDIPRSTTLYAGGNGSNDSTVARTASGAHGAVDKVAGAADQAAGKLAPAIEHVAEAAHHAVDKAVNVVNPTVDWVSQQSASLMAGQRKIVGDTRQYVTAHPWRALGVSVLAGWLIGRYVR